jgi:hypothetical protein
MPENYEHQMVLLILPHDGNYKYAVTIADVGTGICDAQCAQPITQKTNGAVKQALETIYARSILKMPQVMVTDAVVQNSKALSRNIWKIIKYTLEQQKLVDLELLVWLKIEISSLVKHYLTS